MAVQSCKQLDILASLNLLTVMGDIEVQNHMFVRVREAVCL